MPRRTDIHSILIIGSGPIIISQGCEFDYSGVQACRALKEERYRIVLINSNPATIMTDPEFADATYIEPITPEAVEKILELESRGPRPVDAVLPTLGGQTGLNTAMACYDKGIFTRFGVQMIGANRQAIFRGEDRQVFKDLMIKIGLKVPLSGVVHTLDEARKVMDKIGLRIQTIDQHGVQLRVHFFGLGGKSSEAVVEGTNILNGLDTGFADGSAGSVDQSTDQKAYDLSQHLPETHPFIGTGKLRLNLIG